MKTLELKEAKAKFSSIMEDVLSGEEFALSFDQKHEAFAVIVPYGAWKNTKKEALELWKKRVLWNFQKIGRFPKRNFAIYEILA